MDEAATRRRRWWDELFRLRYRLLLVNLLIVSVPLVGIGFARMFEREMLRALEDDMVHQAQLLRQALLADPGGTRLAERGPLLAAAARETRTRIRLLDGAGALQADSHAAGPPEGEEQAPPLGSLRGGSSTPPHVPPSERPELRLADRAEVRRALEGKYGAATRVWRWEDEYLSGERVYLFSAVPIARAGQAPEGVVYVTRSTVPVLASLHRLRTSLVKIFVAALVVTAFLSLFLAATISRPITRLMRAARHIAAGGRAGDSLPRAGRAGRGEIGELARALDTMARQLNRRAEEIAELAAHISHEFKSPLTSLRGGAELLLDGADDDPETRRRFLRNMLEDTHRLDRLVTRLLELSRLEADTAAPEALDWQAVIDEAVHGCRDGAAILVHYRASRRRVEGRRAHLVSALRNLLENAQSHARPGSPVTVSVEDGTAGGLVTAVHNDGDPITPANLPRIWTRFFTTRADRGGTGLGLPIVAAAARGHGGRVTVDSSAAAGTTFRLELPAL
jgi:two-component system, OmpR family, sensor histidine kinase ChvG